MNPPRFEAVYEFGNLLLAAKKALKSRWKYRREAAEFRLNMAKELSKLKEDIISRTYEPLPYRTFIAHDPKERLISAAPIRDRVVHHALINVIGPWLERSFIVHSYACRVGRGTHKAIEKAQEYAHKYEYYVHHDVRKFFDTVDHEILKKMLGKKIEDDGILWLCEKIIAHTIPKMPQGKSVPIGNLTSQYFGNLYLDALDHFVKDDLGIKGYLRYMDDCVILHNDQACLQRISEEVIQFGQEKLKLTFAKSFVHPIYTGIPFLGLRIFADRLRLQGSRWRRFKKKFRQVQESLRRGTISEERFTLSAGSMVSHIEKANTYHLREKFFERYGMEFEGRDR